MADDSARESQIAEFSNVTGVDSDRAKFFLESSNWQLQVISLKQNSVTFKLRKY